MGIEICALHREHLPVRKLYAATISITAFHSQRNLYESVMGTTCMIREYIYWQWALSHSEYHKKANENATSDSGSEGSLGDCIQIPPRSPRMSGGLCI